MSTVLVGDAPRSNAALVGYEKSRLGGPDRLSAGRMPAAPCEAVGSSGDFSIGDHVRVVGPGKTVELSVVGLTDNAQIQVSPTLFVAWPDYLAATRALNPDATTVPPSVIGVRPVQGERRRAHQDDERHLRGCSTPSPAIRPRKSTGRRGGAQLVQPDLPAVRPRGPLVTGLFFRSSLSKRPGPSRCCVPSGHPRPFSSAPCSCKR